VRVPEVVRDVRRRRGGRKGLVVAAATAATDGEEDQHALGLAVRDVGADVVEVVAREFHAVPVVAQDAVEGDGDGVVQAGVAGLSQGALVLVPSPEHGQLAGPLSHRRGSEAREESHGQREGCKP